MAGNVVRTCELAVGKLGRGPQARAASAAVKCSAGASGLPQWQIRFSSWMWPNRCAYLRGQLSLLRVSAGSMRPTRIAWDATTTRKSPAVRMTDKAKGQTVRSIR